jgi:anti-repressor protein
MNIIPFQFGASQIRTVLIQDEPYFVAVDICRALGYIKPQNAVAVHCKGALKQGILTNGGTQEFTVIPERDVYRLIMRSKLPAAEKFEEWVVSEVLPEIRKTGSYQLAPRTYSEALRALADAEDEKQKLAAENARLLPAAEFAQAVMGSDDMLTIGQAAKVLNLPFGRTKLFEKLRERRILMANNVPYQEYVDRGYFRVTESRWQHPDTGEHITLTTRVLQRGLDYIRKMFLKPELAEAR